jgi:hypothetical protein
MAIEKVIDIKVQGNGDEAVGSLRSQLRQAQADVALLSEKFGVTSREATEAAKKAGELKDRIGDAKALTDAFNPDAKFKALSSSLAGVAGGFAAVQGAQALFGKQSEEVEKTLLKVQSAMAISQGLQTIGESVDSFKQLGAVIKSTALAQGIYNFVQTGSIGLIKANTVATEAQTVATEVSTVATATASNGLKLFRLALIGTGIGALVVGVGLLISNFDKVKATIMNLIPGLADVGKFIGGIVDSITDFVGATSDATRALDKLKKDADNTLAVNKKFMQEHGDQVDEYTKKKIDAKNAYAEAIKADGADQVALAKRLNRELANADKEREDDLEKKRKEAREKKIKDAEKNKLTDAEIKERQKELDKKNTQEIAQSQTDFDVSELVAIDAKNQAKRDKDAKFIEDTLNSQRQYQLEVAQITYDSETEREAREEEARQRRIKSFQDTTSAIGSIAKSGEDLLASLQANGIAKSKAGQAVMKGLALVQIATDSAIAFSKMMQGTESSAAGAASVAGPAAPAVYLATKIGFYASGTATILSNIARARALLSGGNDGGGGASGSVSAPSIGGASASMTAPSFNTVGSSATNQIAQTLGRQSQEPIRSYVVASDVSTAQALDRSIITNASIGG